MKKQKLLLIILISWLSGLTCCSLFTAGIKQSSTAVKTGSLLQQATQAAAPFTEKITAWHQKNKQLSKELAAAINTLSSTKNKNRQLQSALQQLLEQRKQAAKKKDTLTLLAYGDTLQQKTGDCIQLLNEQDSLHSSIRVNLTQQLTVRDSIIYLAQEKYHSLEQYFNQSLAQQKALEKTVQEQDKKLRRRQTGHKLKTLGLLLLAGIVVSR